MSQSNVWHKQHQRQDEPIISIIWKEQKENLQIKGFTYMNLVPIETWSFSKVFMKSLGSETTSSYLPSSCGYGRKFEESSLTKSRLLPPKEVEAIALCSTINQTRNITSLFPSLHYRHIQIYIIYLSTKENENERTVFTKRDK